MKTELIEILKKNLSGIRARFRNRLRRSENVPPHFPDRLLHVLDEATMYELSEVIGPNLIQVKRANCYYKPLWSKSNILNQVLEEIDSASWNGDDLFEKNSETFECKAEECFKECFCNHYVILTLYTLCYQDISLWILTLNFVEKMRDIATSEYCQNIYFYLWVSCFIV